MLSSANTGVKSTKVTARFRGLSHESYGLLQTHHFKYSEKISKTCYAIYARVKLHKQMCMAMYNMLLTHGKNKIKKICKGFFCSGTKKQQQQ